MSQSLRQEKLKQKKLEDHEVVGKHCFAILKNCDQNTFALSDANKLKNLVRCILEISGVKNLGDVIYF